MNLNVKHRTIKHVQKAYRRKSVGPRVRQRVF